MIGMVNVPCDSPLDFYAAPMRQDSCVSTRTLDGDGVPRTPTSKRTPSYRPVFTGHRQKIQYSEDGRKISDGVYLEQNEPNKLWEELFLRSFAQRLEDEIQSPVAESFKNLDEELAKLNVTDKSLYRSTYSLVSSCRAEETPIEELERIQHKPRSASNERSRPSCVMLPFIKCIKGRKEKKARATTAESK